MDVDNNNDNDTVTGLVKEHGPSIIRDPELRKLKPGSDEFKAGVIEKFGKQSNEQSQEDDTDDSATSDDTSTTSEADNAKKQDKNDKKKKPKDAVQRRFDQITAEKKAALERADALQRQIDELNAKLEGMSKDKPNKNDRVSADSASDQDDGEPSLDDFETVAEYTKALVKYEAQRALKQNQDMQDKTRKGQEMISSFFENGAKLEQELGLDEGTFKIIVGNKDFKVNTEVLDELFESSQGAHVAYKIASDERLIEEFSALVNNPKKQVRFIARIEAQLEAEADRKKKEGQKGQTSSAKRPPASLPRGGATNALTGITPPKNASADDWRAWRAARRSS